MSLRAAALSLALFGASACIVPQPEQDTDESSETSSSTSESTSETGVAASCGWDPVQFWYACGLEGSDPNGVAGRDCAVDYVAGEPCPSELLPGCCDANGDLWFCQELADQTIVIATLACG